MSSQASWLGNISFLMLMLICGALCSSVVHVTLVHNYKSLMVVVMNFNQMKQMNQAAVLIQKYYRRYKNSLARSKELERAALFIQQMYRYNILSMTTLTYYKFNWLTYFLHTLCMHMYFFNRYQHRLRHH